MPENCSSCGSFLGRPIDENANYVRGDRWNEKQEVEVVIGLEHTAESRTRLDELDKRFDDKERDVLAAEAAQPRAESERGGEPFSIPEKLFNKVELRSAEEARDNTDIAYVYVIREEREVPKTALVCPECTEDGDEIIWGSDGE